MWTDSGRAGLCWPLRCGLSIMRPPIADQKKQHRSDKPLTFCKRWSLKTVVGAAVGPGTGESTCIALFWPAQSGMGFGVPNLLQKLSIRIHRNFRLIRTRFNSAASVIKIWLKWERNRQQSFDETSGLHTISLVQVR